MLGARPRTLPAAIVPVLVGTAAAHGVGPTIWWRAGAAMAVSLALQIGTNYANDYSDGVRGTDDVRVGPVRLVAGGLAPPAAVKRAAFGSFALAALVGLGLAAATTWWLIAVGALSIAAGWFYTGGSKPYGYAGFGELFVFVFFGLVATVGSEFVQIERTTAIGWVSGCGVGALIVAILVANNLRDIPTDTVAGKKTLAVRMGDVVTRRLYMALVAAAFVASLVCAVIGRPAAAAALAGLALAAPLVETVRRGALGRNLIPVLAGTGRLTLAYGVLFAAGLWISA